MEFEQLEAFVSVAKTKNFTRSAELLHVAQSTITTRIKLLEERLGKSLFDRDSRRVELSTAGRSFLPYAERILEVAQEGEQFLKLQGQYEEHFVVGSTQSLWDFVLFPAVRQFRLEYPEVSLRQITGHSADIVQRMLDGLVDVGVVYIPPHHPDIEIMPLFSHSLQLVAHPSFPLEKTPLTPDDLKKLPFFHLNWGPPFTEWYEQLFGKHYIPTFQADNATTFVRFVLSGDGLGFLLDDIAEEFLRKGELKKVPLPADLEIPKRDTYLIYPKRKKDSRAIQALIKQLDTWKSQKHPDS